MMLRGFDGGAHRSSLVFEMQIPCSCQVFSDSDEVLPCALSVHVHSVPAKTVSCPMRTASPILPSEGHSHEVTTRRRTAVR